MVNIILDNDFDRYLLRSVYNEQYDFIKQYNVPCDIKIDIAKTNYVPLLGDDCIESYTTDVSILMSHDSITLHWRSDKMKSVTFYIKNSPVMVWKLLLDQWSSGVVYGIGEGDRRDIMKKYNNMLYSCCLTSNHNKLTYMSVMTPPIPVGRTEILWIITLTC